MVKDNDSVVKFLGNVLNRLQQTTDRETFKKRAKNLKKKINDNETVNKTTDRETFRKRANWIEKKNNTSTWSSHQQKNLSICDIERSFYTTLFISRMKISKNWRLQN